MGLTNLDEQFTFYASYHHDTVNKLIHILCVWPIIWSALVLTQYVPIEVSPTFLSLTAIHPINFPLVAALFYASVYISMDKRAGTLAAALMLFCLFTSRKAYLSTDLYGYPIWQVMLLIQIVAWGLQFVGHGAFEHRAPALLDNLIQAVVMAPLFVFLEVMFAFGYRKDFQEKMWKNVEREIAKLNAENKKK